MSTVVTSALSDLDLDLFDGIADELAAEAVAWLTDPSRTAHPLVTLPTAELVAQALGTAPAGPSAPTAPRVSLPGGLWRILPDRLLALHPARRTEQLDRLRITTTQHLHLTALVLEQWGWAKSNGRIRTASGRRCILGAQNALLHLGYGTPPTAAEAGRRIQGALHARGITYPYPEWNELPHVGRDQVLAVVRQAAREEA